MMKFPVLRRHSGRIFLIFVVAVAAIAAGLILSSKLLQRSQDLRAASLYPQVNALPEFALQTADGEAFTRDDLEGQWSLLFFGFTNCPDICPDTLSLLASVMEDLKLMGAKTLPQVVFVSVDPQRDRGDTLGDYVSWFNEDFVGVTGEDDALEALTSRLGIHYSQAPAPDTDDEDFYTVNHSASVMIVDPQARLLGLFGPPLTSQDVAADLFSLMR